MNYIKLLGLLIAVSLFFAACGSESPENTQNSEVVSNTDTEVSDEYWAKENLDLQRVGVLLEEADDAKEFEYLINKDNGVNNLDLNGDGYVDYIGVTEYKDPDTGARGFSLFDKFGVDDIQEIATIIFDRDRPDRRGARIYIDGNDQIYGDDYFYERDWLDKSLNIVDHLFGDRRDDDYYESPYYYDNYPDNYTVYRVVETPLYRTRVTRLYPEPVFVKTKVNPAMTKIMIKSPYYGKYMEKIHAKLVKPTREQKEFYKNNPKPSFVKVKDDKRDKRDNKFEKRPDDLDKPGKDKKDKPAKENKPEKLKEKKDKPDKTKNNAGKKEAKNAGKDGKGDKGNGKGKSKDKP